MPSQRYRAALAFTRRSTFATLTHREGVLTICFAGPRVTEREAFVLSHEFQEAFRRLNGSLKTLVLDLHHVTCMTSMGLGMCIDARHGAKTLGARTVIYGLNPQLSQLFRMTKVDRLYKIARTEAQLTKLIGARAA